MSQVEPVEVTIYGQRHSILCPPEDRQNLIEAAQLLDQRMQHVRQQSGNVDVSKIAVLAALNITYDYLHTKVAGSDIDLSEFKRRLETMNDLIDSALLEQNRLF